MNRLNFFQMKGDVEAWAGNLPETAQVLLQEFEKQYSVPRFTAAIVRWEIYAALHVKVNYLRCKLQITL